MSDVDQGQNNAFRISQVNGFNLGERKGKRMKSSQIYSTCILTMLLEILTSSFIFEIITERFDYYLTNLPT